MKVEIIDKPVKVYNFQVEDFHTYHVGENCILVHNASYDDKVSQLQANKKQGEIFEKKTKDKL